MRFDQPVDLPATTAASFLMLVLCWILSILAVLPVVLLLSFEWSEFIPLMRVYWLIYVILIALTLYIAQVDHNSGEHRLRGILVNLVVIFGFPLGIFLGASFNA